MKYLATLLSIILFTSLQAQDTYSIVAVDTATGRVGSAGASCIDDQALAGGVSVIGDLIPGLGAINTQSFYLGSNQLNAKARLLAGDSPQQVINWLINNDAQGDPSQRQYGIAAIMPGGPEAAAYTGVNCFDVKYHKVGADYAIQGNILLDSSIIDSMEAAYLRTAGQPLEFRLMAAMLAANTAGADSRCAPFGLSSLSSYLRVADTTDGLGLTPSLDLIVPSVPGDYSVDPIDSLYTLFLATVDTSGPGTNIPEVFRDVSILNMSNMWVVKLPSAKDFDWVVYDLAGALIDQGEGEADQTQIKKPEIQGNYILSLSDSKNQVRTIILRN